MRTIAPILLLVIAACTQPADNPTRQVGDEVLIALQDGWNCYQGRCFQYHAKTNQIQAIGHERTGIPVLAEIDNGEVTPRNFLRLFNAALNANDLVDY
jgi:hypothetical protein